MTIAEALSQVRHVQFNAADPQVFETVARELARRTGARVSPQDSLPGPETVSRRAPVRRTSQSPFATRSLAPAEQGAEPGVFRIVASAAEGRPAGMEPRVDIRLAADGSGSLACSHPRFLYGSAAYLLDVLGSRDLAAIGDGLTLTPTFTWNRSCYDIFLTQEARVQHGLDRETYVRRLAESGFTHIEVNGLAYPMGLETGPKGEVYPMFYTYCPALDQFVYSELNKGLYPFYYLSENLGFLKRNAALARKYGLVPGLLSFEPRSVPEEFFARYPMLRGARVDHPFRSFKPRYTMTIAHPIVGAHYAEMLRKLMAEVPELGFLTIWTNDSGSGFEHTRSLYVGRNGGPYMIREWKDHDEVARVAGEHALTFFRVLRDAARAVNPEFRVITRLESFMGEHDTIWHGLGDGLDVETVSLIARGWEMPYRHPGYPDSRSINGGSVCQLEFDARERSLATDLKTRGAEAHFYCAVGPHQMFAPLLGVPYPTLTYRRLELLHANGVGSLSQIGGTFPPELVPFNVNHEIMRRFQFDPGMDIEREVAQLAGQWAGEALAGVLVAAWKAAEQAILAFPNVCTLYSTIGFTWYRLWARPLVPNIEAIPREERAYYEDFMCTTPHNPNNVDLSRDVLFTLTTPAQSRLDVERMDANVWPPLDRALTTLRSVAPAAAAALGTSNVIADQLVRLEALHCWLTTQRNLAAWVAAVYGWMEAGQADEKARHRQALRDLMAREIDNSTALARLLDSGVEFMATTDLGETPLIHGRNLESLLSRRIALMHRHMDDEPFIDHNYMMRVSGSPLQ